MKYSLDKKICKIGLERDSSCIVLMKKIYKNRECKEFFSLTPVKTGAAGYGYRSIVHNLESFKLGQTSMDRVMAFFPALRVANFD